MEKEKFYRLTIDQKIIINGKLRIIIGLFKDPVDHKCFIRFSDGTGCEVEE